MNKKGQGISINVIVVAAVALLVLVVLVVIFGGRLGIFNEGVEETDGQKFCIAQGGICSAGDPDNNQQDDVANPEDKYVLVPGDFSDCSEGKQCYKRR